MIEPLVHPLGPVPMNKMWLDQIAGENRLAGSSNIDPLPDVGKASLNGQDDGGLSALMKKRIGEATCA